ncbi:MAG TPA: TetR/AcrR family transcriptional regulator [Anaerolineae bacterium]|nr:TetR/AcrR family transcriptional regulator [Anaerolineae bacterium]
MPKLIDDSQVFTVVIQIFMRYGYEGTKMEDVAAAADINKVSLFRKYDSKLNLIALALNQLFSERSFLQVTYTGDLEADLTTIVQTYLENSHGYEALVPILMVEIPRHPELVPLLDFPMDNLVHVAQLILRYQHEGLLAPGPFWQHLSVLLGPLMTGQLFRHGNPNLPQPNLDLSAYVSHFLDGRRGNNNRA